MRNIISCLICLFIWHCALAQKFEVINSTLDNRGVAEDGKQIVIYGNGLTWINTEGKIEATLNLIDGMSLSMIVDVVSDGAGGLWILTWGALGHVDANRKGVTIFSTNEFGQSQAKALKVMPDKTLYVLLQNKIIQVSNDFKYSVYFTSTDSKIGYFQVFDIDENKNIYIGSFREVFILNAAKNITTLSLPGQISIQNICVMRDHRIFLLEYSRLYEIKNNELSIVLDFSQLSLGAKFYTGIFNSSDDYWLYANQGNVFHFKNGTWTNFIPPAGMKTGNFGECMIQTGSGDIWMSLGFYPHIFHYDGTKWHKLTVKGNELKSNFTTSHWARTQKLVSLDMTTFYPLQYNGTAFAPIPGLPQEKTYKIAVNAEGQYYWSNERGIYTKSGNEIIKVVELPESHDFEILGDELLFIDEHQLCIFKNGKKNYVDPKDHHLGWDELSFYGIHFYYTSDDHVFITSAGRSGQISTYSKGVWGKIIDIEGKKIGEINNIISYGDQTFVITSSGSVALYANKKFNWVYFQKDPTLKIYRSFLTSDGNVWYIGSDNALKRINKDGLVSTVSVPYDRADGSLNGVLKYSDEVYHLYFEKTVFRLDFN